MHITITNEHRGWIVAESRHPQTIGTIPKIMTALASIRVRRRSGLFATRLRQARNGGQDCSTVPLTSHRISDLAVSDRFNIFTLDELL
jgi:hypothetical protein